jgi:citrate synthase
MSEKPEVVHTKIWKETSEPDNPFAAEVCECSGFDVYGDLLGKISWIQYLYLLFKLEPPSEQQAKLLEGVAVAIANPGPRDLSVRAAMNGGVGGSTSAACLIAALAPGAGQYGGAREVYLTMRIWSSCGHDLPRWNKALQNFDKQEPEGLWPAMEHPPGFDPYGVSCATPVKKTLSYLSGLWEEGALRWLCDNQQQLEEFSGHPLTMTGVIAAALVDVGFSAEQGEMLFLLLRLPGAAAHALEQKDYGWTKYPFFSDQLILQNDPGAEPEHGG